MNINFFKPRKKKKIDIEPSAPPEYSDFLLINEKDMVCWW